MMIVNVNFYLKIPKREKIREDSREKFHINTQRHRTIKLVIFEISSEQKKK